MRRDELKAPDFAAIGRGDLRSLKNAVVLFWRILMNLSEESERAKARIDKLEGA